MVTKSLIQRVAEKFATRVKHPEVVKGLVDYLKGGPFKSYLRIKSTSGNKVTLIPQGLNDQVERVEISSLQGDKAEFVIFLTNGDSGWAWDERRQPPKFHNDAGYNIIHLDKLDRIANPKTDPEKFEQHMMSLCKGTLVPAIQRAGWVIDPATKRPIQLDQWQAKQETPKPEPVKPEAEEPTADLFRSLIIKAIKRVGDGVRTMGLGSIITYNPQEPINTDRYDGIHATFFLRFDHPQVNAAYRPGISFYWDPDKKSGTVSTSNLVWKGKRHEQVPLGKMGDAMLDAADDIVNDLKRQLKREHGSEEAWSVVTLGRDHGYATEVQVFDSKSKAEAKARDLGNCYVVKGTQMWNEPLGQVEEHNREAPYKFFREAGTTRLPKSLGVRSGWELRIIGYLSDHWPFHYYGMKEEDLDLLELAAAAVDKMKKKHKDMWEGMQEANLHPKEVAEIMVDVMIKESQTFK